MTPGETKESIDLLNKIGIKDLIMLTGDNEEVASKIAKELNIKYEAELLPEDKLEFIKLLKKQGKSVAMTSQAVFGFC